MIPEYFEHPFRTSLFLRFSPLFVSTRLLSYVLVLRIKNDSHTRIAGYGLIVLKNILLRHCKGCSLCRVEHSRVSNASERNRHRDLPLSIKGPELYIVHTLNEVVVSSFFRGIYKMQHTPQMGDATQRASAASRQAEI